MKLANRKHRGSGLQRHSASLSACSRTEPNANARGSRLRAAMSAFLNATELACPLCAKACAPDAAPNRAHPPAPWTSERAPVSAASATGCTPPAQPSRTGRAGAPERSPPRPIKRLAAAGCPASPVQAPCHSSPRGPLSLRCRSRCQSDAPLDHLLDPSPRRWRPTPLNRRGTRGLRHRCRCRCRRRRRHAPARSHRSRLSAPRSPCWLRCHPKSSRQRHRRKRR